MKKRKNERGEGGREEDVRRRGNGFKRTRPLKKTLITGPRKKSWAKFAVGHGAGTSDVNLTRGCPLTPFLQGFPAPLCFSRRQLKFFYFLGVAFKEKKNSLEGGKWQKEINEN